MRPRQLFEPGGGLPAFDVQKVLERDRQARERTVRDAVLSLPIGRVGIGERVIAIDRDEGMQVAIVRVDMRKAGLDDRARARLAARESREVPRANGTGGRSTCCTGESRMQR